MRWKPKSVFCIADYNMEFAYDIRWYTEKGELESKTTLHLHIRSGDRMYINRWYEMPNIVDKTDLLSNVEIAVMPRLLYECEDKFVKYIHKDNDAPKRKPDLITYEFQECWCIYRCAYVPDLVVVGGKNKRHAYLQWQDREWKEWEYIAIPKSIGVLWDKPSDMSIDSFKNHRKLQVQKLDRNLPEVLGLLKKRR